MNNSTALVTVDGVLRKLAGGDPLPEGITLYHALASKYSIVLGVDADTDEEHDRTTAWLEEHGLMRDTAFVSSRASEDRVKQASSLRRQGYAVDLVVEPDPGQAGKLYHAGFTVLLFLSPVFARPEWRPEYQAEVVPWDELVQRVTQDKDHRVVEVQHGEEEL